jgi:hypothetical protein
MSCDHTRREKMRNFVKDFVRDFVKDFVRGGVVWWSGII